MNRLVNKTMAIALSTAPLFGIAPSFGQAAAEQNAMVDPLDFSDRLLPRDPAADDLVPAGESGGSRGGCIDCADNEAEANCASPIDATNGGCNSSPPVFGATFCGAEFCGTFATDGSTRDTDWWLFELQIPTVLTVRVQADVPLQIGIANLADGCPIASLVAGVFSSECSERDLTRTLEPGVYAAFVAPQFGQSVPCGARYTGALLCDVSAICPCPGDFNSDRVVSLSDLTLILSSFGQEPSVVCMDTDQDGMVGLQDLANFLPTFGLSCPD